MYAGIDIGGTKTLVAALDDNGVILDQIRFATPKNYDFWVHELRLVGHKLKQHDFRAAGVGIPGVLDRKNGRGLRFGNLPWANVPILNDVERAFHCPTVMDNDAKMAALSEAMLLKDTYSRVLYVTISTGIGYGLVVDGRIDDAFGDPGGKSMLVEHRGRLVSWESFASGHAIVKRYGKRAADIDDATTWRAIVRDFVPGLLQLIAITEPEVIVFGGSVGVYFDKYGKLLRQELKKFTIPLVPMPELCAAARPEEAVIYGCYDLAKQAYEGVSHANAR